jgi:hypothetical protein
VRVQTAEQWHRGGVRPGVRRPGERPRWERCIEHRGVDVEKFAGLHFGGPERRLLLVGGAGFDPRSTSVARLLTAAAGDRISGLFLRERRPNPAAELRRRAEENISALMTLIPRSEVVEIDVFEDDGAVVLGRRVATTMLGIDLKMYSDVVVDFSALSIGSSFPATRYLLESVERLAGERSINLHAMVAASPSTDERIVPSPGTSVEPVPGFLGRYGLDESARATKLWMPQLRFGHRPVLERIFDGVRPDEVIPVLPFPARDARVGDRLIAEYVEEFSGRWEVDARSMIYAAEDSPLDYYRTVLRIHDGRHPVYESTGGNLLILSPVGSKVLALGAMMAAMERDLPVIYVEALGYSAAVGESVPGAYGDGDLVHVWLTGEAYPTVRF